MKIKDHSGQKLKLAAILMCSLGTAHAQSSVTLYGALDGGLIYTSRTLNLENGQNAGKQFSLINGGMIPSTFGLTGREDLGNGWTAKFKLESGISLANGGFDNSNGNLFGREAWVSLASNYGEAKLGLQYSPFMLALFESDPRSFAQFGGSIVTYVGNSLTGNFDSNAVSYTSPKIAGFTGSVLMALGGVPGNFNAGRQYSASLEFDYGGLMLNAGILDEASSTDTAIDSNPLTEPLEARTLGMAYSFSNFAVKASFTNFNAPLQFDDNVRNGGDNNVYNAGFIYYFSPGLFNVSGSVAYIDDRHDSRSHSLLAVLSTQYYLSKRTSLYLEAGITNNCGTENIGLAMDGAMHGPHGATVGAVTGMTHTF